MAGTSESLLFPGVQPEHKPKSAFRLKSWCATIVSLAIFGGNARLPLTEG